MPLIDWLIKTSQQRWYIEPMQRDLLADFPDPCHETYFRFSRRTGATKLHAALPVRCMLTELSLVNSDPIWACMTNTVMLAAEYSI